MTHMRHRHFGSSMSKHGMLKIYFTCQKILEWQVIYFLYFEPCRLYLCIIAIQTLCLIFLLRSVSKPDARYYGGSVRGQYSMTKEDQIGLIVDHTYTVSINVYCVVESEILKNTQ